MPHHVVDRPPQVALLLVHLSEQRLHVLVHRQAEDAASKKVAGLNSTSVVQTWPQSGLVQVTVKALSMPWRLISRSLASIVSIQGFGTLATNSTIALRSLTSPPGTTMRRMQSASMSRLSLLIRSMLVITARLRSITLALGS